LQKKREYLVRGGWPSSPPGNKKGPLVRLEFEGSGESDIISKGPGMKRGGKLVADGGYCPGSEGNCKAALWKCKGKEGAQKPVGRKKKKALTR